ncbi:MAG: Gfo/Idh/MocA family protein, partial [Pontimonas sp.]
MIDMFREISEACALGIPSQHHKVVGVIGAGGIVSGAHLPAYKKAGLAVHAITDIDDAKATAVAKDFDIPHVYSSAEELLQDDAIEVVDIAVPASEQPALLLAALQAGKHVLAQKPLATTIEAAEEMAA